MEVIVSARLRSRLAPEDLKSVVLAFRWWKSDPANENRSPVFGKDSANLAPAVNGEKFVLRHCHLIPLCNKIALAQWEKNFARKRRKTSDRVLFYAQDPIFDKPNGENLDLQRKFYLIDIADDPGAHELMRMSDAMGKRIMSKIADEAELFLYGAPALAK